ncbi:MAG: CYTH domain-containing protein [Clostridia bacterium]|nr:CYTH domain-containing protein [Clostridia bacterium]
MNAVQEIERKWLVDISKIPFDLSEAKALKLKQAYISYSPTIRIRSTNDESFMLCVKSKPEKGSLGRSEYELEINREQYDRLLAKAEGNVISKTRYCIEQGGYTMEFDIFDGDLTGLCYMEIEFPSEEEAINFPTPEWAIKDVSFDHRYKNTALSKNGKPNF